MRKKRFEILSQKEIMDAFNCPNMTTGGPNSCEKCALWKHNELFKKEQVCGTEGVYCSDKIRNFLNETIDVEKRWETFKSDEDVSKMLSVYNFFYKDKGKSLEEFLCEWVEKDRVFEKEGC